MSRHGRVYEQYYLIPWKKSACERTFSNYKKLLKLDLAVCIVWIQAKQR